MSLLRDLQCIFENTYGREAGVDLETCVVGPRRCAELAARSPDEHHEMSDWARFFYYIENHNLRVALFYGDEMIATLETRDPRRSLSESNVLPFLVFSEECSHALHTSFAFGEGGAERVVDPAFLTELELMARIDAYLVLRHFVHALSGRFTATDRAWALREAVTRWDVGYEEPELEQRYRQAARMAGGFVERLESLPTTEQLGELRDFRTMSLEAKRSRLS